MKKTTEKPKEPVKKVKMKIRINDFEMPDSNPLKQNSSIIIKEPEKIKPKFLAGRDEKWLLDFASRMNTLYEMGMDEAEENDLVFEEFEEYVGGAISTMITRLTYWIAPHWITRVAD